MNLSPRPFGRFGVLLLLLNLAAAIAASASAKPRLDGTANSSHKQVRHGPRTSPNFVFILADDCSYRDLELYGGPARTPHLNQLAEEGMTFSRCYQAAPMCSPTRHALYTGLYPVRSGAYPNHARAYENVKSIPHYLKKEGYRVALAGKTHIDPKTVFPFEYLEEFAEPENEDVPVVDGWRYPQVFRLLQESAWNAKPFCLFLCSNEPHGPYTKGDPAPYQNTRLSPQQFEFQRDQYARYLAEITYFDGQVGEIVRMLDELNLREETLLMAATEQGSSFPFGKWTCYEIGVASGLVASWPGTIKAGSETDAIVEYTDIVPSFLEAAGAEIPESLDGRSFLAVLRGETASHSDHAFSLQTTRGVKGYEAPYGIRSVVGKRHRYIRNLFPENEFSIPSSRRVYEETRELDEESRERAERYLKRPPEELYDILEDPWCLDNLAGEEELQEIKTQLSRTLDDWMADQGDTGTQVELDAHERQADWYRARLKKQKAPNETRP